MVIAFLRGKNRLLSTSSQQDFIISYANKHSIAIEMTEIDNTLSSKILEDRELLQNTLLSLKVNDIVLIYDLWVFSQNVDELVKIFDCIIRHSLILHLCSRELIIDKNIPSGILMNLLSEQRERNLAEKKIVMGRPKGSFSKSKFDIYKSQIVMMIDRKLSVSEIAKKLNISRSSLKDYIKSRSLKELVELKATQNKITDYKIEQFRLPNPDECPLIKTKTKG